MSERHEPAFGDEELPDISIDYPPLPRGHARRLLRREERVTWVRGPRFCPWWEPYVTHPIMFLFAAALAAMLVWIGPRLYAWPNLRAGMNVTAFGLVLGSIVVLAFFNGFFTRLVVTNRRIVVLQGYEVIRSWRMDDLPASLIRFRPRKKGLPSRSIDLEALQSLLTSAGSGQSSQFADAKTIHSLARQLDRIKAQDEDPR